MKDTRPVRLAIVGCGAMTELGHLPALQSTAALKPAVLIDPDESRAQALAKRFNVPHYSTRLEDAALHAEAACVVVPHHVHTSVACELLGGGLHILMEKPLAVTVADCDIIIEAARTRQAVLAVAMVRRFARSTVFLKDILQSGVLGAPRSFKLVSGVGGVWPTRSAYLLNAEQSGGGVVMSNGVHDLDLLSHLFGPPTQLEFYADADFGKERRLESDALINMTTESGAAGVVELSRTRDLTNGLWIEFDKARIYSPLYGDEIEIQTTGGSMKVLGRLSGDDALAPQTFIDMLTDQLDDFAAAVRGEKAPMVDGLQGRATLHTVERCYGNVIPLELPWRRQVFVPERA